MASFASSESIPPLPQIVIRGRTALQAYNGPSVTRTATTVGYSVQPWDGFNAIDDLRIAPVYSPNGQTIAVVHETKNLSLYNATNGEKVLELNVSDAQKAEFSPLGTFIVTWSRPTKGTAEGGSEGNYRVWRTLSGELVAAYSLKTYKPDGIQWTADEAYCFRMVSNEVHIHLGQSLNEGIIDKVYHKGLVSFKVSPTSTPLTSIAVFNPDAGGKPARVTLYQFKGVTNLKSSSSSSEAATAVEGPFSSRTIFSASEVKLLWNSTGTSLLVHSHSDVDNSNSSYYGATGLYILMAGNSDVSNKVEQSKEGPIHDVQWSPAGDKFVVAAGTMPCHSTLYNAKGEPIYQYGAAHRNTISWAPHGRFLCLAGFGNLAGEMDFYDTLRLKKIGSNISHCSTAYSWSPDSSYFMTASLAPRMNVDNGFKIFKYNGVGPVVHQPLERAFDALWRPAAAGVYPVRNPSPKKGINGDEPERTVLIVQQEVKPKAAPYRPPGSSGDTSNFMKREEGPSVGKIKPAAAAPTAAGAGGANGKPAVYVPKARVIPGMAPAQANAAATKKPQQQQQQQNQQQSNSGNAKPAAKPAAASAPAPKAAPSPAPVAATPPAAPVDPAVEREKRLKNVRKKLKQVEEIKAKQASGQALEPEQVQKLATEAALLAELRELS